MNITLDNGIIHAVISSLGAEMQSLKRRDAEIEYLWQGNPATYARKAINIFPYVARLTDGMYYLDGKQYKMQPHGFIQNMDMSYKIYNKDTVIFSVEADRETLKHYPRHFRYQLKYQLLENKINITHKVNNLDTRTMYFGLGGHPGFILPLDPSLKFEDYYLEFHTSCEPYRVGMSDTCYVTGCDKRWPLRDKKIMTLCHEMFDEDAIILRNMSNEVQLKSDKGKYSVTVSYPDMKYLGIWHWPKAEAPYVCIEPWSSLPSRQGIIEHFEQQENLIRLDAGKCYVNTWSISLH